MSKVYLSLEEKRNLRGKKEKQISIRQRKYRKKASKRYYHIIEGYKSQGCSICGYNKCSKALCFHHIDPTGKDMAVAKLRVASVDKLVKEIEKCIVVCANCHAEIHERIES